MGNGQGKDGREEWRVGDKGFAYSLDPQQFSVQPTNSLFPLPPPLPQTEEPTQPQAQLSFMQPLNPQPLVYIPFAEDGEDCETQDDETVKTFKRPRQRGHDAFRSVADVPRLGREASLDGTEGTLSEGAPLNFAEVDVNTMLLEMGAGAGTTAAAKKKDAGGKRIRTLSPSKYRLSKLLDPDEEENEKTPPMELYIPAPPASPPLRSPPTPQLGASAATQATKAGGAPQDMAVAAALNRRARLSALDELVLRRVQRLGASRGLPSLALRVVEAAPNPDAYKAILFPKGEPAKKKKLRRKAKAIRSSNHSGERRAAPSPAAPSPAPSQPSPRPSPAVTPSPSQPASAPSPAPSQPPLSPKPSAQTPPSPAPARPPPVPAAPVTPAPSPSQPSPAPSPSPSRPSPSPSQPPPSPSPTQPSPSPSQPPPQASPSAPPPSLARTKSMQNLKKKNRTQQERSSSKKSAGKLGPLFVKKQQRQDSAKRKKGSTSMKKKMSPKKD